MLDTAPLASNASTRRRVAVVINFLTHYREDLYRRLLQRQDLELTIFCHLPPPGSSLKSIHDRFPGHVRLLPARFMLGETIVWSTLPWHCLTERFDAVYVEGNPRYLAFALLASWLQWRRKTVVLWTMVQSFRNHPGRQRLRLAWTRSFSRLLVYSDSEVALLRAIGFESNHVVAINNGLNQDRIDDARHAWTASGLNSWRAEQGLLGKKLLLSCARLEDKNKFDQLIDVLPQLVESVTQLVWCVIGDGAAREALQLRAEAAGVSAHVRWVGALHDEARLAPWFLSASALVHPGAIGLTLLHAFGYGLPVVTHARAQTHGPEFTAMVDGEHGLLYPEDDSPGMAQAVLRLLTNDALRGDMSARCLRRVQNEYNTRTMAERFMQCLNQIAES
jgi:glycosyltransferase involved in cell wall biosynthesis